VRVVADTNTVVSAFLWAGPPKAILDAAREQQISLHTSPALLAELEDVLSRDKFAARIRQVGSAVTEMLAEYRARSARRSRPRLRPRRTGRAHRHP
jgi:putative PIN family toxin of toxin-antitoxin system